MPTERRPRGFTMRLCNRGKKPNTARMKRLLKALGVTVKAYMAMTGGQPLNAFHAANPHWSGRAWEVLVLENLDLLGGATGEKPHKSAVSDRRYAKKTLFGPQQARMALEEASA